MQNISDKIKTFFSEYKLLHFNQRAFYYAFLFWVKHLFSADIRHVKIHREKMDRPVVIVANHISGWDPFLILSAMHRDLFFKNLFWRIPAYHGFFKKIRFIHYRILFLFLGVYPIGGHKGDLAKSLEKAIGILNMGHSTIFFPEGKRVRVGEKAEPKPGISFLLKKVDVYVLPVHLDYSHRRKNGRGAGIGKAKVTFGELIKSEHFVENHTDDVRHRAVMEQVYALEKAEVTASISPPR